MFKNTYNILYIYESICVLQALKTLLYIDSYIYRFLYDIQFQ